MTDEERGELASIYWELNSGLVEPFPAAKAFREVLAKPISDLTPTLTPYIANILERERAYYADRVNKKIRCQELLDKLERGE